MDLTRRGMMQAGAGAAALGAIPGAARGAAPKPTPPVETTLGKLRGLREGRISAFRGIPYGADTAARRFLPPVAAPAWSGVRDCFAFGHRAPQASVGAGRILPGADPARIAVITSAFKEGQVATGNESEDCLVLNVFTPDATPRASGRCCSGYTAAASPWDRRASRSMKAGCWRRAATWWW